MKPRRLPARSVPLGPGGRAVETAMSEPADSGLDRHGGMVYSGRVRPPAAPFLRSISLTARKKNADRRYPGGWQPERTTADRRRRRVVKDYAPARVPGREERLQS